MGTASLFAQEVAVDQTGRQITLLIGALLCVAAILALMTVWYWRYTDPKKRQRRPIPAAVRPPSSPQIVDLGPEPDEIAQEYADDEGMSVDEWLHLTGPTQRKN